MRPAGSRTTRRNFVPSSSGGADGCRVTFHTAALRRVAAGKDSAAMDSLQTQFDGRDPTVLLVDDNPDDRELALMAIRQLPRRVDVVQAADGIEAMEWLQLGKEEPGLVARAAQQPALILLDVNMPRLDGKQFLRRLRADERLARLPVVMFTTSTAPWDVDECYDAGCNVYLVKPFAAEELVRVLGDLFRVFLDSAELPTR